MIQDILKQRLARKSEVVDIITFATASWGLKLKLFPVQQFLLKVMHGMPLDRSEKVIKIYSDKFKEKVQFTLTEWEYLQFLKDEGRITPSYEEGQERRETVLAIGRRGSKTRLSSIVVNYNIYKLMSLYNPQEQFTIPEGDKIGFAAIATSQDQARELFTPIRAGTLGYLDPALVVGSSEYEMKLLSRHDHEVFGDKAIPSIWAMAYPCTGRGVRGAANMVVVLDEFAHFILEGGNRSDIEVYKAVTPSVSSFGDLGKIISISSPLSKSGKFYELFKAGIDGDEDILSYQAPCWEVNERLSSKILKADFRKDPDGYLNEYGAQWSGHVIDFIRDTDIFERNINRDRKATVAGKRNTYYFMGLDVGLAHDPTGICISHVDAGKVYIDLIEEIEPPGVVAARDGIELDPEEAILKLDTIAKRISDLCDLFLIKKGCYDHWNGYGLGEALTRYGRKMHFEMVRYSRTLNSQIYKLIKQLLFENRVEFYPHPKFEQQFKLLQETKLNNHEIKVAAPVGDEYHDDMSDAVVRSVHMAFDAMEQSKCPIMVTTAGGITTVTASTALPAGLDTPAVASEGSYRLHQRKRLLVGGINPRYSLLSMTRGRRR